ncbi:replication initiation factor domain-containing protein [Kingella negevensis]|uniref:replication initiation factor domain-containing protein n=1 Tax=Kingella negevensis TaxID=1522312 RepID=UPI0025437C32|nr:replication initiation factor domain-containing protein [Kingella negevensis]WII92501.1 replication initiation factor domain-containing protein [Kingella negevensis]
MNISEFQKVEYFTHYLTDENGNLLEIPFRRGIKDGAFIDWVTFTFRKETIELLKGICLTHDEYVCAASEIVHEIFGFGVTEKIGKGKYFYDACYRLGSEKANYGTLHFGGQRDTVLVEISGKGCMAAIPEWEQRLYELCKKAVRFVFKRIDIARDFFHGEYSPEQAEQDELNGLFVVKNMRPKSQCIGTDWRCNDGSGKTFKVGANSSHLVCRVYDKGKELGDKNSDICRFECQYRGSKQKILPFDMLLYPGEYLAGVYPFLSEKLFNSPVRRVETVEVIVNTTFAEKREHGRNQIGRLMRFMRDIGWSDEQIVKDLIADEDCYPKGLNPEEYDCRNMPVEETYIHQSSEQTLLEELDEVVKLLPEKPVELSEELRRWFHFKSFDPKYADFFRQAQKERIEKAKQEAAMDRYIDYIWEKYGTFFYKKKR